MPAFFIGLISSHSDEWLPEYLANVPEIIRGFGGEYLGVSGADTSNPPIKQMEGQPFAANLAAVFTFPSIAAVEAFLGSDAYRPYAELRKRHTDNLSFAFEQAPQDARMTQDDVQSPATA